MIAAGTHIAGACVALNWRNVTPSTSPACMVKGTELNVALCGLHSRYQICEVRAYDAERNADRTYLIRDAYTVSDDQVRDGVRPSITYRTDDLDAAIAYCTNGD